MTISEEWIRGQMISPLSSTIRVELKDVLTNRRMAFYEKVGYIMAYLDMDNTGAADAALGWTVEERRAFAIEIIKTS